MITDLADEHAQVKQRVVKHNRVPYRNSQMREAINVRKHEKDFWDTVKTLLSRKNEGADCDILV